MDPFEVTTLIDAPRERVFDYLRDIANHAEFSDHYLVDWHLLREDTVGTGAGARFRAKAPFARFDWADATFVEVLPHHRIVSRGRGGKANRIRILGVWELDDGPEGTTRVRFTIETLPAMASDRFLEALGQARWLRRQTRKAVHRLRSIMEEGSRRGQRATIAAR